MLQWAWLSGETVAFSYGDMADSLSLKTRTASVTSRAMIAADALDSIDTFFVRARSRDDTNTVALSNMVIIGTGIPDVGYLGGGLSNAEYLAVSDVNFAGSRILSGSVTAVLDGPRRRSGRVWM